MSIMELSFFLVLFSDGLSGCFHGKLYLAGKRYKFSRALKVFRVRFFKRKPGVVPPKRRQSDTDLRSVKRRRRVNSLATANLRRPVVILNVNKNGFEYVPVF